MYNVFYYSGRGMARRDASMDRDVADHVIEAGSYPAPHGDEVAEAIRHDGQHRYGYDGAWHDEPPAALRAPQKSFYRRSKRGVMLTSSIPAYLPYPSDALLYIGGRYVPAREVS